MHNIGSYLFWALAACTLLQGSWAEDQSETSLEGKIQELQAKITQLENQFQEVLNKIENQLELGNKIPPGFKRIGTRYFRLGEEYVHWYDARKMCEEMGGYLTSFQSEEEFTAVAKTFPNRRFWLGINDLNLNGHFVSVASHKSAKYLKWAEGQPSKGPIYPAMCVSLKDGQMWRIECESTAYFLCQADNET